MYNNPPIGCCSPRRLNPVRAGLVVACLMLGACTAPQQISQDNPGVDTLNIADAAIAGGHPQMALNIAESTLQRDPHDLQALYHEGAAYYAMDRCEDSIAAYKIALQQAPNSSAAETGIGRCLIRRNAPEAERAFTAAVADDPTNADAQSDLGIARALSGNAAGAVRPLQQALLLSPGNIATEVNLGMAMALSGDSEDALQYLGPLAISENATPKIRADYALALVGSGRAGEAQQVLTNDLPPTKAQDAITAYEQLLGQSVDTHQANLAPAETGQVAPTAQAAGLAAPVSLQITPAHLPKRLPARLTEPKAQAQFTAEAPALPLAVITPAVARFSANTLPWAAPTTTEAVEPVVPPPPMLHARTGHKPEHHYRVALHDVAHRAAPRSKTRLVHPLLAQIPATQSSALPELAPGNEILR